MLKGSFEWPNLTETEREIRALAEDVAKREIEPRAAKHDIEYTFVRDSVEALAEAGLLGVNVPKKYGGLGGSDLAAVIALEAISSACGSTGAVMCFHYLTNHLISNSGPEELRQKYLPLLAKNKLAAWTLNEGPWLFYRGVDTSMQDHGDYCVVNGGKPFVTTAGEADMYVCYVQWDREAPIPQFTQEWVVIERGFEGVSAPLIYRPLGLRGASNGQMKYDNVKVPRENIIGEQPWSGLRTMQVKDWSAIGPQVVGMGCAAAALDAAAHHVRTKGEMAEWMLHELGTTIDRLNAFRCYEFVASRNMSSSFEATVRMQDEMKRLGGADMYWICDKVIEMMGGRSLMEDSPIQRYYRDARTTSYLMTPMESRRLRVGRHIVERDAAIDDGEEVTMPWEDFADHGYSERTRPLRYQCHATARARPTTRSQRPQSRGPGRASTDEWTRHGDAGGLDGTAQEGTCWRPTATRRGDGGWTGRWPARWIIRWTSRTGRKLEPPDRTDIANGSTLESRTIVDQPAGRHVV